MDESSCIVWKGNEIFSIFNCTSNGWLNWAKQHAGNGWWDERRMWHSLDLNPHPIHLQRNVLPFGQRTVSCPIYIYRMSNYHILFLYCMFWKVDKCIVGRNAGFLSFLLAATRPWIRLPPKILQKKNNGLKLNNVLTGERWNNKLISLITNSFRESYGSSTHSL